MIKGREGSTLEELLLHARVFVIDTAGFLWYTARG
jgi:hypothetical protein